eukprot:6204342-Pleurochrysis_carterae.AAC.4
MSGVLPRVRYTRFRAKWAAHSRAKYYRIGRYCATPTSAQGIFERRPRAAARISIIIACAAPAAALARARARAGVGFCPRLSNWPGGGRSCRAESKDDGERFRRRTSEASRPRHSIDCRCRQVARLSRLQGRTRSDTVVIAPRRVGCAQGYKVGTARVARRLWASGVVVSLLTKAAEPVAEKYLTFSFHFRVKITT